MTFIGNLLYSQEYCAGIPNGDNVVDNCDICDSDPSNDCIEDCNGEWGGTAEIDECGECGGDGSTCIDSPVDLSIDLIAGWNWIFFNVLPEDASIGSIMAELGVDALFINSQSDGTATNYPQYGMWAGLLATLKPGVGYLLSMDADVTFYYPEFDGLARLRENKQEVILSEKISNWDFNYADYEFIGTITASIESHEDSDGDIVSIFVDDECRGIAERTYFSLDNTYYYIIQVYSNITEGEDMTFKYYDSQNDEVIEYSEMLTFTNNMIVGDGFNTFSLSRIAPSEFLLSQVYPNPFNPTTTVSFAIPVTSNVILEAYDIKGRLI